MEILILGGTGAMGIHLIEILSQRGDKVFVTSRRPHENKQNITYICGNAHEYDFIVPLLKRKHWDAIVDFMVYNTDEFSKIYPLYLNSTCQYVFLSSSRVYAGTEELITENSIRLLNSESGKSLLSTDEYAITKARQEDMLFGAASNNWTIIRPYITYSENRLQLGILEKEAWLYRAMHRRSIVFYNDVASRTTTLTYGKDVSTGIAATIGNKAAYGEAFHITTSEFITWGEVLNVYCETISSVMGFTPKVTWLPRAINNIIPSAEIPINYDRLYNRKFDNSKIKRIVPDLTFMSPREGLKSCVTYLLEHPRFLHISYGMEALRDRVSGDKMQLSEADSKIDMIKYSVMRYFPSYLTKYLL